MSEQRRDLERAHADTVQQLHDKRQLLANKTASLSQSERRKNVEAIETLQSTIRELEKKTELQNVRHEELVLELAALKQREAQKEGGGGAGSGNAGIRAASALEQRPQSPLDSPTLCSTPRDSLCSLSSSNMMVPTHQRTTSGGGGESSSYSTTAHQPTAYGHGHVQPPQHLLENNTGTWRSSAAIAAAEEEISRRQRAAAAAGEATAIYSLRDDASFNLLRELNKHHPPSAAHFALGMGVSGVLGGGPTSGPHSLPRDRKSVV